MEITNDKATAVLDTNTQNDTAQAVYQQKEEDSLLYQRLFSKNYDDHADAIFEFCFLKNIPYIEDVVTMLQKTDSDELLKQMPQLYVGLMQENVGQAKYAYSTFFDQLQRENFDRVYKEKLSLSYLSEDDKKNRMAVIDILCYDPFKDDDPADRPQLYRDLTAMLSESMRKDVAKAKAALSIVRGYNNLEKYQRKINEIMQSGNVDDDTQKTLDQYVKVQKTLQDSINTTAEKNNFTVKGIGTSGKGMLSDVMNQIGEKGIDEGVTNFYDISTSKAIEEIANISFRAQLNQVGLSKTDYADILNGQAQIVRECQAKAATALEALRIAREKLKKQELIDELEMDYRKKGIDESEIQDFINREYEIYSADSQGAK